MAENSNFILEANKSYLNENDNSLLLDSDVPNNDDSCISRNSAAEADNCSLGLDNLSYKSNCLTSTANDVFSEFHCQNLFKYSEIGGSLSAVKNSNDKSLSLNNNTLNSTLEEDIFSAVPGPDFIKNSPSSEAGSSNVRTTDLNNRTVSPENNNIEVPLGCQVTENISRIACSDEAMYTSDMHDLTKAFVNIEACPMTDHPLPCSPKPVKLNDFSENNEPIHENISSSKCDLPNVNSEDNLPATPLENSPVPSNLTAKEEISKFSESGKLIEFTNKSDSDTINISDVSTLSEVKADHFQATPINDRPLPSSLMIEGEKSEKFFKLSDISNGKNASDAMNLSDVSALSEIKTGNFQATPTTEKNQPLPSSSTIDEEIFKFPEPSKLISISDSPNGVFTCLTKRSSADVEDNFEGEEFQDAVQFFKDPSSLQYLENMEKSEHEEAFIPRNSLFMNFDPLHKTFVVPTCLTDNSNATDKDFDNLDKKIEGETSQVAESSETDSSVPIVPKPLPKLPVRESFGNILLSFDSPLKSNSARNSQRIEDPTTQSKLYTEEELQQVLKINELTLQEMSLKNQREMEEECQRKVTEKDEVIKHHKQLCLAIHQIVEELAPMLLLLRGKNQPLLDAIKELESEKQKLQDDLKTSNEDLQSVEHTFSDFHKRYVQCKDMLKTYKDNEDRLKEQVDSLNKKIEEQDQMYNMLQTRTEEMVSKANAEVANAKRGSDAQVAVLKAQLKKSELKISSLESDLKQVKIENDNLGSICDDLMAKVSES